MRTIRVIPGPAPNRLVVQMAYSADLIAAVRAVPGREWDKKRKTWTIPSSGDTVAALKNALPVDVEMMVPAALRARIVAEIAAANEAKVIRDAGDADVPWRLHSTPYAHQRAGLAFLDRLGSGALLWEMGTGKTAAAIAYAEGLSSDQGSGLPGVPFARILVICPNTVKRSVWASEIPKHAGHSDLVVADGTSAKRIAALGTRRYTIINCESLSLATVAAALVKVPWDLVIVDESTRFKNPKAARTKALLKLGAAVKRRVILSGTPFTDGVGEDAWSQFEFVQPGTFGSFPHFRDRYLALDFWKKPTGIKPELEKDLHERLDRRSYRVLKRDVLDLPPKVYTDRIVTLEGDQKKAYDQMRRDLRVEIENMPKVDAFNILTVLLRLTQITAGLIGTGDTYHWIEDNAKARELDNLLTDELAGERVVIFGLYQKELENLSARYATAEGGASGPVSGRFMPHYMKGYPPIIYGPTPEPVRAELIEQFQRGDRRLLFVQSRTGGIGITLTAAQTAIYVTRGWGLEEYLQSQDRLHRIGQTGTVSIVHLVAQGTIDEDVAKVLAAKQDVADKLTGDDVRNLVANVLGD